MAIAWRTWTSFVDWRREKKKIIAKWKFPMQSMRREYESVQAAKGTQEDEMRALKDRMMLGGAARNRMLVKGGSAFNGLVRAMKQDLVEGGAGAAATRKDPNALYEDHQRVLNTLQNLTPAQIERLEATLRASPQVSQQGGMLQRPQSTRPPY
ncbi:hypothetical protein DUNSADRAFT_7645 [Dunaliella salina]|uniref:Uncharacterized protein n=1 Tax=Dunaliella salina TaxID=3046 RepID=A0ABQ7H643_DUNSA|nr:hypothetical protein DUNSADRAFT_7645 [Dunaliella salina]|eukprot:KAF5842331.1 hypothetical protein DUNSADRAFT_7645 [Dunaliella salina]